MCYDIQSKLETQLRVAKRKQNKKNIKELEELLRVYTSNFYHVSGYNHPILPLYQNKKEEELIFGSWGLIPAWVKGENEQEKLANSTLNARIETIAEKPSFKNYIANRAVLYVDGFFEHKHINGIPTPYFIRQKNQEPLPIAVIYSDPTPELDKTFSIITTKANAFMKEIHNNPKLDESRMPLLLTEESADCWLNGDEFEPEMLSEVELEAWTVEKLRGKGYVGNNESVTKHKPIFSQGSLF